MFSSFLLGPALVALVGVVAAHGDHSGSKKPEIADDANWMEKHMAEEHHIAYWDTDAFFVLHDYNSDGLWHGDELMRTYGLMDDSNAHVKADDRMRILRELLEMLDQDGDAAVSKDEWTAFIRAGKTLPDMGTGPGHHGDDEYEYEIHHWEKYHDDNTQIEDLVHPEDIAHFKKHEEMEEEEERLEQLDKIAIVVGNIPQKFLRAN